MATISQTHAESIGELSYFIDRAVANVAHGRFERSLVRPDCSRRRGHHG